MLYTVRKVRNASGYLVMSSSSKSVVILSHLLLALIVGEEP